ncbi:hypothetical protein PtA15_14A455 [Puccinia triticina]|uniref:F-box domain-containing protein n=1 Tax=Puccinia triticina TaxID=208348 RepID=A0ABY7D5F7_9BASI|nr:uncharacterized protein PtA15_14A455 [Puccinia triticina]WAQ91571.1 hypothetical protein PtA15_14A455 [Puccinia triticina]
MDPPSQVDSQAGKRSLSDLPTEIKLRIIECLERLMEKHISPSARFLKLALVDRTFYELCSPSNWKMLDLKNAKNKTFKLLINDILPHQASKVRSLTVKLEFSVRDSSRRQAAANAKPLGLITDGFEKGRFGEILKLCANLTELKVVLEHHLDEFDLFNPAPTALHPIAQLTNLTYIHFVNHTEEESFKEEYLVDLIRNMVHLVHIRLDRIAASFPTCDFCECPNSVQPVLPPLAVHLASLSSLRFIDFSMVDSFDWGWSKMEWKGALEGITLHRNTQLSFRALHRFCSLFQDSLVSLSLCDVPLSIMGDDPWTKLTDSELKYVFRLPKLKNLSVYTPYSTEFINLFRESSNITTIHLVANYQIGPENIKALIKHESPTWIDLKSLLVQVKQVGKGRFRPAEIVDLVAYSAHAGIKIKCGSLPEGNRLFTEYQAQFHFGHEWRADEPDDNESERPNQGQIRTPRNVLGIML